VVIFFLIFNIRKRKSLIGITIIASFLLPDIQGVDASNIIFLVLMFVAVQYSIYKRIIFIPKEIINYLFCCSLIFCQEILSWAIKNPIEVSTAFISSFSVLRYPMIIFFLYIYESSGGSTRSIAIDEIYRAIIIVNIANMIACILQKTNKNMAFIVFSDWYSYSNTYIAELSRASRYYRAYGTWNSAVTLGVYALISLAILFYVRDEKNNRLWLLNIICCCLLGILSLTKMFFLGIVMFIILEYILYLFHLIKNKRFTIINIIHIFLFILTGILLVYGINYCYEWSRYNWPHFLPDCQAVELWLRH